MTGSYHNYFRIYDVEGNNDVLLQADKSAFRANRMGGARTPVRGGAPGRQGMNVDTIDFNKKILHGSWHPRENTIAVSPPTCPMRLTILIDLFVKDRRDKQPVFVQRGVDTVDQVFISHELRTPPTPTYRCLPHPLTLASSYCLSCAYCRSRLHAGPRPSPVLHT